MSNNLLEPRLLPHSISLFLSSGSRMGGIVTTMCFFFNHGEVSLILSSQISVQWWGLVASLSDSTNVWKALRSRGWLMGTHFCSHRRSGWHSTSWLPPTPTLFAAFSTRTNIECIFPDQYPITFSRHTVLSKAVFTVFHCRCMAQLIWNYVSFLMYCCIDYWFPKLIFISCDALTYLWIVLFVFSIQQSTRVMWTPPLRESFAYPFLVLQMLLLTYILRYRHPSDLATLLIKIVILHNCKLRPISVIFTSLVQLNFRNWHV